MPRAKIAIVHPRLGFGGSEIGALQAIDALKQDFDVTLITGGLLDLESLNRYYSVNLNPRKLKIHTIRMPLALHRSAKFAGLRGAFVQRYARRVAGDFDLMISAYNPCDFGAPGIQFIADFSFIKEWRDQLHPTMKNHRRWWYQDSPLRRAYLGLCDHIAQPNPEAWKRNVTIAKCKWAADLMESEFGIQSRILYPPVAAEFPSVPWQEKENGFVCIGRVVPEKRMDTVIRILEKVRRAGHDVHLHILGGLRDSPFGAKIRQLAATRDWVSLEGRTFGRKKIGLIAGHRFGINACENDNMPNAVAEMVKGEAIAFVPASGGQTEIVDHPALTFRDEDDAVSRICTVLSSNALQQTLREHLARQALKFSVENFKAGFRQVVFEFLNLPIPQCVNDGNS